MRIDLLSFDQNESFDLLMDFKCSDHVVDPLRTRRATVARESRDRKRESGKRLLMRTTLSDALLLLRRSRRIRSIECE